MVVWEFVQGVGFDARYLRIWSLGGVILSFSIQSIHWDDVRGVGSSAVCLSQDPFDCDGKLAVPKQRWLGPWLARRTNSKQCTLPSLLGRIKVLFHK